MKILIGWLGAGISLGLVLMPLFGSAQVSFNAGKNNLELSGAVYTVFNLRFSPGTLNGPVYFPFTNSNNANLRNNRFEMRNVQLNLEGRYANLWEYQLQFNMARLMSGEGGGADPENPVLMDAYVSYVGNEWVKVKAGFQKVPYSRSSLVSYTQMPFIQRAEMVRGEVFGRRDAGVTLYNDFWNQRLKLYAGLYTGQGESILMGRNDVSGNFEWVARAELAYPSRYRYREVDDNNSAEPMVVVGVNARSNKRSNPFAKDSLNYGLKNLQGQRDMWGFDVSAQYMNWSAQFEWHQMRMTPTQQADYLQGYEQFTDHFNAGGFLAQLNYNLQDWNSVVSVRYDRFNSNDLVGPRATGENFNLGWGGSFSGLANDSRAVQENLSFAYNYKVGGWNSVLRAQYVHRLKKDLTLPGRLADDQLRIGWQYLFR